MSEHDSLQEHADAGAEHMAERREIATHQRLDSGELVPLELAADPMQMVARALEKGIDGPMLQQFMDLQLRHEANEARKAYAMDMSKCQAKMPAIMATVEGEKTNSVYAKLGQINALITPVYTKCGFSISFGEGKAEKEGEVRTVAKVLHKLGHVEEFYCDLPLDLAGAQGTVNKTGIHAKGSSNTYGERYIVRRIFNLSILSEDDDGNMAGGDVPGRITDEQALTLDALVSENELSHTAIQREFRVAGWPQLAANRFDKVHARITQLIEARNRR
jgi:hypothetical protein